MEFVDSSVIEQIEMKMIRPSQFAIRDKFQKNDCDFETLVNSIREHGLLQPILIRPLQHSFEIVAGHRRFQACRTLRWRFIPAKIRELSDKQAYEIQLTENIQRKSMDPIEEAEAFRRYVIDFGWGGVSELAKKIGKSEEYVSHHMQLLKLPDEIKDKIVNNSLKVSQAIEIVQIPHDKQQNIASEVISNNLTVRQIRELKMALREEEKFDNTVISPKEESRSPAIAKKASLTLKITLARVDNLINEVHTTIEPDQRAEIINFLMGIRLTIHSLIDESIRFKNKKCDS
ncbi:MAG: ParB/RepB/Spo0J family partition protein [Thermoproteota archaeon]|jgi:ParB family transcriptional regulator, chromosome partitioning protein|nr:ParB/RepB/Spo0J family partition protein [Thermoproteota archaeon]